MEPRRRARRRGGTALKSRSAVAAGAAGAAGSQGAPGWAVDENSGGAGAVENAVKSHYFG